MENNETYKTTAPKKKEITIDTGAGITTESLLSNSVHKHKKIEEEILAITGAEIRQQNENL